MSCKICVRFRDRLISCRNYNSAFIDGSTNLHTSAFKDHAHSDMHNRAMQLLQRANSKGVPDNAPIARALFSTSQSAQERIKKKFQIAYCLSKENMAFTKMGAICELEQLHKVDLGEGYKNRQACTEFVEYISLDLRQSLANALQKGKFFSVQVDGSTDAANVEEELFVVLYFNPHTEDGKVGVCSSLLSVRQPSSGDAAGLYESFERAMVRVDVGELERQTSWLWL